MRLVDQRNEQRSFCSYDQARRHGAAGRDGGGAWVPVYGSQCRPIFDLSAGKPPCAISNTVTLLPPRAGANFTVDPTGGLATASTSAKGLTWTDAGGVARSACMDEADPTPTTTQQPPPSPPPVVKNSPKPPLPANQLAVGKHAAGCKVQGTTLACQWIIRAWNPGNSQVEIKPWELQLMEAVDQTGASVTPDSSVKDATSETWPCFDKAPPGTKCAILISKRPFVIAPDGQSTIEVISTAFDLTAGKPACDISNTVTLAPRPGATFTVAPAGGSATATASAKGLTWTDATGKKRSACSGEEDPPVAFFVPKLDLASPGKSGVVKKLAVDAALTTAITAITAIIANTPDDGPGKCWMPKRDGIVICKFAILLKKDAYRRRISKRRPTSRTKSPRCAAAASPPDPTGKTERASKKNPIRNRCPSPIPGNATASASKAAAAIPP